MKTAVHPTEAAKSKQLSGEKAEGARDGLQKS